MVENMGSLYHFRTFRKFIPRNTTANINCGIILAITLYSAFAD